MSLEIPLRKSEAFPSNGRYLFHLHTTFTDGQLAVRDYFEHALSRGIDQLVFLEHIRREPTYDVDAFVAEVHQTSNQFRLPAVVGFEAKLLPDGELDISERHRALAEVLGIAEHSFPDDLQLLQEAFRRAVDNYSRREAHQTLVWVHPGLWFQRRHLLPSHEREYLSMIRYAIDRGVLIEKNIRYGLVPERMRLVLPQADLVSGVDAHSVCDLVAPSAELDFIHP